MSDIEPPEKYFGPRAGANNSLLTGIGPHTDTGEIVVTVYCPFDETLHCMTEVMCFEDMEESRDWHRCPDVPKEWKDLHEIETKIMHYALSSIQCIKIDKGIRLSAPLTPHPDVEFRLHKPKLVPNAFD